MLNPPLNQLQSQINSKYLIATTAAKRARELDEKPETALLNGYHSAKPVGEAPEETCGKFHLLYLKSFKHK